MSTVIDAGTSLACPRCGYNVRDLPSLRCPECGECFTLDAAQVAGQSRGRVAFELARGFCRIPAFLLTALTVLIAPWRVAKQLRSGAVLSDAVAFLLLCFVPLIGRLLYEWYRWVRWPGLATSAAWVLSVAIFILAQAGILALLSSPGARPSLADYTWGMAVGCYTSAIVMVEAFSFPPLGDFRLVIEVAHVFWIWGIDGVRQLLLRCIILSGLPAWLSWVEVGLWMFAVICCAYARVRRFRSRRASVLVVALLLPLLFNGYLATCTYVAAPLYKFLGGR